MRRAFAPVAATGSVGAPSILCTIFTFAVEMGITAMLVTILHGVEGSAWAGAYRFLRALPDIKSAMLYSLGALTTYGHADVFLEDRWKLVGPSRL